MSEAYFKAIKSLKRIAKQHARGIELFINLTHECPLRCSYCYVDYEKKTDWSQEKLEYLVDTLIAKQHLIKLVTFFGGEPGLKYDVIKSTLEYAERKGMGNTQFAIITSLSSHANKLLSLIDDFPNLEIVVSMDSEKDSKRVTAKGQSFIPIVRESNNPDKITYDRISKYRKNVIINKIVLGEEELRRNFQWLHDTYDKYGIMFSYNFVKDAEKVNYSNIVEGIYHHLLWCKDSDFVPQKTKSLLHSWVKHQGHMIEPGCGINSEYFLDGTGITTPCSIFHSLKDDENKRLLMVTDETGKISEQMEMITELEKNYFDNPTCLKCDLKGFCNGGCLALRYQKNGDFNIPNTAHCDIMLAVYRGIELFKHVVPKKVFDRFLVDQCGDLVKMMGYCTDKNIYNNNISESM